MLNKAVLAALVSATFSAQAAQAAIITDGSFETQGAATGTCSFNSTCAAGAWSGSAAGHSGINFNDGQNFAGNTPDGQYYGFLQSYNGTTPTISQTVTVAAGTYLVSWLAGGRTNYSGAVDYTVSLNGLIYSGSLAQAQPFTATSAVTTLAAGTYTLTFSAHTAIGDNSALIDGVSIISEGAVPEPASWAMMLVGMGAIGFAARRRRNVRVTYA